MMKVKSGQLIRERLPGIKHIFTEGFQDRYLRPVHRLSTIIEYIKQNPYRLLVRQQNPDFFRRVNNIEINGTIWQAYGNLHLFDNPFKAPVIIHRADTELLRTHKYRRWKHLSENGGVLISPFISQPGKEIRRRCEEAQGRIILISNKPFGEKEKPAAHEFGQCVNGRLLILAPMTLLPPCRKTFLYLNSIAESIALSHSKL